MNERVLLEMISYWKSWLQDSVRLLNFTADKDGSFLFCIYIIGVTITLFSDSLEQKEMPRGFFLHFNLGNKKCFSIVPKLSKKKFLDTLFPWRVITNED